MTDPNAARDAGDEIWRAWSRLVARAWNDTEFKQELLRRPVALLEQSGVKLAETTRVRVVELSPDELVLPLPAPPAAGGGRDERGGPAGDQAAARLLRRFQPFMNPFLRGRAPDSRSATATRSAGPAAKR